MASKTRLKQYPESPAVAELYPGFEGSSWFGAVGPAKMPKEIVARLHKEISRALVLPEVRDKLTGAGVEPGTMSPEEFGAYMRAESETLGKLIRQYNIRVE